MSKAHRSSSSMGLVLASLQRGSNGGFKASSSYRNGGNEMGERDAPNGGRKPEFGGSW